MSGTPAEEHPTCRSCGRVMTPRRRWRGREHEVRYCSARCRSARPGVIDRKLEAAILDLLRTRARGATICPSEAAMVVEPDGWKRLMERTRCAARRLVASGEIDIVQRGRVVDPSTARGPIRLRLRR